MSEWLEVKGRFTIETPIRDVRCGFCDATFSTNKSKAAHLASEHRARVWQIPGGVYEYRVTAKPSTDRHRAWATA